MIKNKQNYIKNKDILIRKEKKMRIWDKRLISVLPREQLIAQWRELSAIAGAIQKNGTPNHALVNFVLDYNYSHFISYANLIKEEMVSRGYRTTKAVWDKITSLCPNYQNIPFNEIYKEKMSLLYFTICYYNLYEKYLCGSIRKQDWNSIENEYIMRGVYKV